MSDNQKDVFITTGGHEYEVWVENNSLIRVWKTNHQIGFCGNFHCGCDHIEASATVNEKGAATVHLDHPEDIYSADCIGPIEADVHEAVSAYVSAKR